MSVIGIDGRFAMNMRRTHAWLGLQGFVALIIALGAARLCADEVRPSELDVPYEPTHEQVVDVMLNLAQVTSSDYLVDLGCGDGRIVIAAAKKLGARGLGVDLDSQRIRESIDNASYAGVSRLVQFKQQDIMKIPIREATVVTMYLLDEVNLMVRPKLFRELRPGTRVVSHAFNMDDWEPDQVAHHPRARGGTVYLWIMPATVGGTWECTTSTSQGEFRTVLKVGQEFQVLAAMAEFPEPGVVTPAQAAISGKNLAVTVDAEIQGQQVRLHYEGLVEGDTIRGTQEQIGDSSSGRQPWTAKRKAANLSGTWELDVPACPSLNGTVYIGREGAATTARYICHDNTTSDATYIWGPSVRIDAGKGDSKVVFRGSLHGEEGNGTAYRQGWPQDPEWIATKIADEAPASLALADRQEASSPEPATQAVKSPGGQEPNPAGQSATPRLIPLRRRQWTPKLGAPQPGDEYFNSKDGSVLIWIPGGEFMMGSDQGQEDERPAHKVAVQGFWLGQFEVTNEHYRRFLKAEGAIPPYHWDDPDYSDPNQPVVGVTWREAESYCEWAGLRLPTEAEWEYAARAGTTFEYPTQTGAISHALANVRGTAGPDKWECTSPVGRFPPNSLGLYDMAGNAWEWTSSVFLPYPYKNDAEHVAYKPGALRVLRGGAWCFPPQYCRTTHRHRFAQHLRCDYPGIRVAMTTPPAASPTARDTHADPRR
jgi:formylglycine-generating enzyme required for sulfatase activity/precorrin-6B methylase 2